MDSVQNVEASSAQLDREAALIDLFYQGEGLTELQHIEIDSGSTFTSIKALLVEKHGFPIDVEIFIEDNEEPPSETAVAREHADVKGLKVHLHRCKKVVVPVTFNGKTVEKKFPPSATIARVKYWAAVKEFGMSKEEAGEHVLQIAGTHERPAPGTHIGTLTSGAVCAVAFHLVPDERVNG